MSAEDEIIISTDKGKVIRTNVNESFLRTAFQQLLYTQKLIPQIVSSDNSDEASASEIIKVVNDAFDGSGGGRADFAQGGSSQKESVDEIVTKLKGLFKG